MPQIITQNNAQCVCVKFVCYIYSTIFWIIINLLLLLVGLLFAVLLLLLLFIFFFFYIFLFIVFLRFDIQVWSIVCDIVARLVCYPLRKTISRADTTHISFYYRHIEQNAHNNKNCLPNLYTQHLHCTWDQHTYAMLCSIRLFFFSLFVCSFVPLLVLLLAWTRPRIHHCYFNRNKKELENRKVKEKIEYINMFVYE